MSLLTKISEQFKKNPHLRVLFFFDAKHEHENEFDSIKPALVQQSLILVKESKRFFWLKYRLETEWSNQKIVLYLPMERPNEQKEFLLFDLLVANKELQLDDVDAFMEEHGLHSSQRALVKRYIKYLVLKQYKSHTEAFLTQHTFTKDNLQKAFASEILGFKNKRESNDLLIQLFVLHSTEDAEKLQKKLNLLRELDAEQFLLDAASQFFKSNVKELSPDFIQELVAHLKYNLITANFKEALPGDTYKKYKETNSSSLSSMKTLWRDWEMNSQLKNNAYSVFEKGGRQIMEERLLEIYGYDTPYNLYTPALANKVTINLLPSISKNPVKAQKIFSQWAQLQNLQPNLNAFVAYSILFYEAYNAISTFTLNTIPDYFENYIKQYAVIDSHYRLIVVNFKKYKQIQFDTLELFESLFEQINRDYDNFLIQLNTAWQKIVEEKQTSFYIPELPKQWNFYKNYLKPQEAKKVVIISDALRYEVAMELKLRLASAHEIYADLDSMVAQLPSVTDFGMAALLPHKSIKWDENQLKIDGLPTQGLENREKILQATNPDARAIKYSTFVNLSEKEGRELFKSNLVYIYHDIIDATGDKRNTENQAFEAVEKAIEELVAMVKRIHSTLGVSYIYITADHGFIYQHKILAETMFSLNSENDNSIITAARYAISKQKIVEKGQLCFPIAQTSDVKSDAWISVPAGINRYKKQGVGYQFVHGGMSLQEIIVPVLISKKNQKVNERKKVQISLINKADKVSANAYKVLIQQVNQVGEHFVSLKAVCCLFNQNNQIVSDEKELLFNSSSPLPTERKISTVLQLGSNAGLDSFFYLRGFDVEDTNKLNPLIEHRVENASVESSDDFS